MFKSMSLPMSGKLIRVGIIQQRSCCFCIGAGDPNAAYQWMKQKVSLQWILILPHKLKIGKMVVYFYYIKEWKITFHLLAHLCHIFNVYRFPRKSTRRKFFCLCLLHIPCCVIMKPVGQTEECEDFFQRQNHN